LGISKTHVKRIVAELESVALIRRIARHDKSGRQQSNGYEFLWHPMLSGSLKDEGNENVPVPVGAQSEGHGNVPLEGLETGRGPKAQKKPHDQHSNGPPLREKEETSSSGWKSQKEKDPHDFGQAPTKPDSQNETPSNFAISGPDDGREPPAAKDGAKGEQARGESMDLEQVHELQEAERSVCLEAIGDESKTAVETWASPQDELRAILELKLGTSVCIDDWDWIEVQIECRGIDWMAFVGDIRKHATNKWHNPVGFVKNFVKTFRARMASAATPKTKGEVERATYKCPICYSRKRGEGARFIDGKFVPCECASDQYIEEQIRRGIFTR
jgi:hypothetical protein